MTTQPITSITEGQRKQIKRFAEDAVESALVEFRLNKTSIQKLIENGDEFHVRIMAAVKELSATDEFAQEEVASNFAYPPGFKIKEVAEQVTILRQLFPELKEATYDLEISAGRLPVHAEGWFAIPRWRSLAPTLSEAIEKMLSAYGAQVNFFNYSDGRIDADYLHQQAKSIKSWKKLGERQRGHDILIVPCQFGLRHRGRSVRRAHEMMGAREFGLGAFAVAAMLVVHPVRLAPLSLNILCAGDEIAWDMDCQSTYVPVFQYEDVGHVGSQFLIGQQDYVGEGYGSVSGFLA